MNLEQLYNDVLAYINLVDFKKIWPNFKLLKFALYNNELCFFDGKYIEKTSDFLGNTSIKYNNEYIAIWNVMEVINPKILASKMIHEMFHGFQNENQEARFPNEIKAIYEYSYHNVNLSLKLMENEIIINLLDCFDAVLFKELLSIRKYRFIHFKTEFLYEAKIEQIEGTANYIELMVLNQIAPDLYLDKLTQIRKSILEPKALFPIRIISYHIGALLIKILIDNDIKFNKGFSDFTITEELIENVLLLNEVKHKFDLTKEINSYYKKGSSLIEDNIIKKNLVMDEVEELLGFNVYNAFYYNNYIISKYFVMYGKKDNPIILYGDFIIESNKVGIVNKIYKIVKSS